MGLVQSCGWGLTVRNWPADRSRGNRKEGKGGGMGIALQLARS